MRFTAAFPILCFVVALILSCLCTFAGTNHDMLEEYSLFTLNTSRLGVQYFEEHKPKTPSPSNNHNSGNFFTQLIHNATAKVENLTDEAEAAIEDDLNKAFRSLAKDIGLHDFYSIHLLDYCEGYFKPNTTQRNVTYCSDKKGNFDFNVTRVLQSELNKTSNKTHMNITLGDLHWPKAVNDGLHDLKTAFHVTVVFYYLAIACTALALLASLVGFAVHGRISALANILVAFLAFFTFMLASAIVTGTTKKAVDVVNKHGKDIDVNAARGDKFIAMTWAGVALCGVACVAWFVEFVIGRRLERKIPKPA